MARGKRDAFTQYADIEESTKEKNRLNGFADTEEADEAQIDVLDDLFDEDTPAGIQPVTDIYQRPGGNEEADNEDDDDDIDLDDEDFDDDDDLDADDPDLADANVDEDFDEDDLDDDLVLDDDEDEDDEDDVV